MKKEKSAKRRLTMGAVLAAGLLSLLSGCGSRTDSRRIVRIGHNQSVNHPTHLALTAFQEMIGERLGDRFRVEVYPSELLGSQTDMVQLTQTGAMTSVWPATPFWRPSARIMSFLTSLTCSRAQRRTMGPWRMRK